MRKLALFLLFSSPLWAQLSVVHTAQNQNSSTASTLRVPSSGGMATTIGNTLAVWVRIGGVGMTVSTITDTAGNTFTPCTAYTMTSNHQGQWWYARNITGNAANALTITFSIPKSFNAADVLEIAGSDSAGPLDVCNVGQAFATTTSLQTPTFSTVFPDEIILVGATFDAVSVTATAGAGYTLQIQDVNKTSAVESQVVSSAQTNVTGAMTIDSSRSGVISVISFHAAVVLPTVTTTTASSITDTSASSGGTVTSAGSHAVASEGVSYILSPASCQAVGAAKTSDGTATPFTSTLTPLLNGETYNYCAYATSAAGTGYGAQLSLTTDLGANAGRVHTSTRNLPVGSTYPEQIIPDVTAPMGGFPQPDVDWANPRAWKSADPITGVLIQGLLGPKDATRRETAVNGSTSGRTPFAWAYDATGTAWTNPNNAFTNQVSGTLASTSTQNAPLFLAPNLWDWNCCNMVYGDMQAVPYGAAASGTVDVGHYLTTDSCSTKLTAEFTQTFTTTVGAQGGGLPTATALNGYLQTWNPRKNAMLGEGDLSNRTYSGAGGNNVVGVSGSTITLTSRSGDGFYLRDPGAKLVISGCAAAGTYTVSHTDTPEQITIVETAPTGTNCTYQDRGFGLCVELKSAGTVNLSETIRVPLINQDSPGTNGAETVCAPQKVTDISTGVDGTIYSPPMSGYLCAAHSTNSGGYVFLVQDDGKIGMQSMLAKTGSHEPAGLYMKNSPWVDSKTFYVTDGSNNIWKVQKDNSGDYTEYVPGTTFPDDRFSYTNLTAGVTALATQIANSGDQCAVEQAKGIFALGGLQTIADGSPYFYFGTNSGGDPAAGYAFFDSTLTYKGCVLGTNYPYGGGMHMSAESVGKYAESMFGSPLNHYDTTFLLGGPFVLPPTGGYKRNGTWTTYTIPLTAATNAAPAVFTATGHDLMNWQAAAAKPYAYPWVTIAGGTGSWAALNGTRRASGATVNTFSLLNDDTGTTNTDSSTYGAYPGGMTAATTPPLFNLGISSIADDGTTAKVGLLTSGNGSTTDAAFTQQFPSGSPHIKDGDSLVISNVSKTTPLYAKVSCAGCSQTSFELFADSALTAPVTASAWAAGVGHSIANAEICPALSTLSLPGPIPFDEPGGPGELPNPQVRCVYLEFSNDICSYWATATEAGNAAYQCGGNVQTYTSRLRAINPGDTVYDAGHGFQSYGGSNHEHFFVLAKDTTSNPGKTRLTLMRWYGESENPFQATHDLHLVTPSTGSNWYAWNHSVGWVPYLFPTTPSALIDTTNPSIILPTPPRWNSTHGVIANMPTPGNASYVPAWWPMVDAIWDVPASGLGTNYSPTFGHDDTPVWRSGTSNVLTTPAQSYDSGSHLATAQGPERNWAADWSFMGAAIPQSIGDAAANITLTPVAGTQHVFTLSIAGGAPNVKTNPLIVVSPSFMYGTDISSAATGDQITDAKPFTFCYALRVNECRTGSSSGTLYISMPGGWAASGQYYTNQFYWPIPVAFSPAPWNGWALQMKQPFDAAGAGTRRITLGSTLPFTHNMYRHWTPMIPAPNGGTWAEVTMDNQRGRARYDKWPHRHLMLAKVPPYPASDTVNREQFVQVPLNLAARTGDTVRVAFGYGENGDPANFYCTTRQETCWTSASPTTTNPFVYAGETQVPYTCSSTCSVSVPAIAGRILFYKIERTSGGVVSTEPLRAMAVN